MNCLPVSFCFIGRNEQFWEIQMKEWFDMLNNDSDTDDNSEYNSEDENLLDDTNIIFTYSECKCDLCININKIEEKWEEWIPKNDIEIILQRAIDISYD